MPRPRRTYRLALFSLVFACISAPAWSTTKGLNQIITPDIQPVGQLSISYQQADPNITNRMQAQFELGITNQFEVAVFQGFSPSVQVLNAEYGLIQRQDVLLSTGFAGWTSNGTKAQPYLEAGYRKGNVYVMAGAIEAYASTASGIANNQTQAIIGGSYHPSPRLLLQVDYQSGDTNFATAGFTYSVTPAITVNPAAYLSNSSPHKTYGFVVATWTITAWK